jgi:hypothetical protein
MEDCNNQELYQWTVHGNIWLVTITIDETFDPLWNEYSFPDIFLTNFYP